MIRVGKSGALSVENVNILYTILVENNVELFRTTHSSFSLSFSRCEFSSVGNEDVVMVGINKPLIRNLGGSVNFGCLFLFFLFFKTFYVCLFSCAFVQAVPSTR
jgi:hypothetical protein